MNIAHGEILQGYYKELIGLSVVMTNLATYVKIVGGKYQILYDRMFNRIMDNSKILIATGIQKENITPIYNGLAIELKNCYKALGDIKINYAVNGGMDKISNTKIPLNGITLKNKILYYSSYMGLYDSLRAMKNLILGKRRQSGSMVNK